MNRQIVKAKKKYTENLIALEKKSNTLSYVRLALFSTIIVLLCVLFENRIGLVIIAIYILVALFFVIVFYHYFVDTKKDNIVGYLSVIEEYEKRENGEWKNNDSYIETDIDYINDLNLVGKGSLFEYINMTKTTGGRNRLFKKLKIDKVSKEDIERKQKQIEELTNNFDFVLNFESSLNDISEGTETDFKNYFYLFDAKIKYKRWPLFISLVLTMVSWVTLVMGMVEPKRLGFFCLMVLIQISYAYIYEKGRLKCYNDIFTCTKEFSKLKGIYTYLTSVEFKAENNVELIEKIRKGYQILRKINLISDIDSFRNNFVTNIIFNTLFSVNFLIILLYKRLLDDKSSSFKESVIALEEMETMVSLATIGYVKKNVSFPKIVDEIMIDFEELRHPLLDEKLCVPNSFKTKEEINIITGSNMSGKTSFMKTIGVNLVLAYNGAYVNAKEFSSSIMNIFTSINVKDDIGRGISTFYGELLRIKNILDYSAKNNNPLVIFIDEIFKGTNYNDRIIGAKETLNKLSRINCIVFLTTHDFELCEIKEKKINNYHFSENYNKNKISFDYKIKDGKCKTTNAMYLMKQVGIIDE